MYLSHLHLIINQLQQASLLSQVQIGCTGPHYNNNEIMTNLYSQVIVLLQIITFLVFNQEV